MNDFAVWQAELQAMDDAAHDLLRALEDIADSHDLNAREVLGAMVMAGMRVSAKASKAGIGAEEFERLQRDCVRKVREG